MTARWNVAALVVIASIGVLFTAQAPHAQGETPWTSRSVPSSGLSTAPTRVAAGTIRGGIINPPPVRSVSPAPRRPVRPYPPAPSCSSAAPHVAVCAGSSAPVPRVPPTSAPAAPPTAQLPNTGAAIWVSLGLAGWCITGGLFLLLLMWLRQRADRKNNRPSWPDGWSKR